ncbi:hypothetical protein BGW36DRAFT_371185 [Talaromyces proteolyticus]|uniref:Uncharacterized protein n=1 Tax=Talaromyces proteolyticus TaxID=1131652 RepID=A0AAD4KY01_9EURO|nr:uncharacterized protein BGW36DRAFT_371185 [Talaromyces proteolyticus]KAH8701612.1 hypothetical protein BGW36DRAFT_371185 [Talaromyces proteolyticus]
MSAVRYFDDIPHIVRFGMHDEKDERCWILFWRNGTKFSISVDKEDVHGTTFYLIWRPLLREELQPGEKMIEHRQNQWHSLCDLIISHSMATLQRLAPDKAYWITLKDYLHSPGYALKLVTDRESNNVYAEVTEELEEEGAYEFQPLPAEAFRNMPKETRHYASSDLIVLEKETNWKAPPQKVCTSDGDICFFKACKRSSTDITTGEVINKTLDSIEVYLKLFKYSLGSGDPYITRRSTVFGIVTDTSARPSGSTSAGQKPPKHAAQTSQHDVGMTETLIAGILLSPILHSQTLANVMEQSESTTVDTIIEQSRRWKAQIEEEIALFHSAGIYWGGRDDWFYINQHTILIDAEGIASLDLDTATSNDGPMIEGLDTRGFTMDTEAVETLFEEWLPTEVSKRR